MDVRGWTVREGGQPMVLETRTEAPGPGEVVVAVAGCGVCHTDLGFFYDGVPTRHGFPLTLGHEIAGEVVEAGDGVDGAWVGRSVVVPAVIPCGACDACRAGQGRICPSQVFPGSDVHGGFASHVRVPAAGLCAVPDLEDSGANPHGVTLAHLSVVADAVSTPYQALVLAGVGPGDVAVFVGAGGVGGFGVQVAAAMGASVVAIDVDAGRLAAMGSHGADLCLDAGELSFKDIRAAVRRHAAERDVPTWRRKIFETSGTIPGQATAFGLVERGGYLGVVGFTAAKAELRLANLMAFDATARGTWGCLPEHYPAIVELVLEGRVRLESFVEFRPLGTINETFEDIHHRRTSRRVILLPETA